MLGFLRQLGKDVYKRQAYSRQINRQKPGYRHRFKGSPGIFTVKQAIPAVLDTDQFFRVLFF